MRKWFDATKKKPRRGEKVLIVTSYGGYDVCCWSPEYGWLNDVRPQHSNGSVTHWQRLPRNTPYNNKRKEYVVKS
jgi:hypothetical protein